MTRKDYVLKLLTAIQDERPLAKGLLMLIRGGHMDDKTIDALSKIFIDAVNKVHSKFNKEKMKKGSEILQKIRSMEEGENNQEELKNLEDMIDNL